MGRCHAYLLNRGLLSIRKNPNRGPQGCLAYIHMCVSCCAYACALRFIIALSACFSHVSVAVCVLLALSSARSCHFLTCMSACPCGVFLVFWVACACVHACKYCCCRCCVARSKIIGVPASQVSELAATSHENRISSIREASPT